MGRRSIIGALGAVLIPLALGAQEPSIAGGEYFVDRDPGAGNGTPVSPVVDTAARSVEAEFSLDVADLALGSHVVYVRFRDANGVWGRPQSQAFRVDTAAGPDPVPEMAAGEYFVDSDPGEGSGTELPGTFSGTTGDFDFAVDSADLALGSHVVYVRFQDAEGIWGRPKAATFRVDSAAGPAQVPEVVGAEYFVDVDPGQGSGTPLPLTASGTVATSELDIDTGSLSLGSHVVYVRFQDANQVWGRPQGQAFRVDSAAGPSPVLEIAAGEYFINTDPGQGNATPLQPEDGGFGGTDEIGGASFATDGLAPGRHVVYTRFQDADGVWGRPQGQFFTIQADVVDPGDAEFVIAAGEYFIDRDPGAGQAFPLTPTDGSYGGAFEDMVGQIETFDLSIGSHTVGVRLQDQNGTWGRLRSAEFTVDEPPPEQPEMSLDDTGPHDFGQRRVDTMVEWTFTVSNANAAPDTLKVRAIQVSPPYSVDIEAFALAPGRSQRVTVIYFPTAEGTFNQNLVIQSNDTRNARLEIQLQGEAVPEQPAMTLSAATGDHDFGAVRLGGDPGAWTLVVGNEGVDTLRVLEVSTEAPFAVVEPAAFNVPPGASQDVGVTYGPTEEGAQSGNLHIRSNDPEQRQVDIALRGEGVEFGVPVAVIATPEGDQSGSVTIDFTVTDDDASDITLAYSFEVGGTRQAATLSQGSTTLTSAEYADQILQLVWDTDADLGGQDVVARFVLLITDEGHPDGTPAFSADFRVDNNLPPTAALTGPEGAVGRQIDLAYSLTDTESDPLSLVGEYSIDGGSTWQQATILTETENITRYDGSILWDAFEDLRYGSFDVRFRLIPSDAEAGEAGEAAVRVVHWVGDYDGDQVIGFEDLTLFLAAWTSSPRDINADIGPASGPVPDLQPAFDGAIDFEDVVVLIQMWNWSIDLYPAAKVAQSDIDSGLLALSSESQGDGVRVDLTLGAGPLLAAALEVGYDPHAWELVQVEAGTGFGGQALVLERPRRPGQVAVQLGGLGELPGPGQPLVHLHFAPIGAGGDGLEVQYDLRGAGGQPLGSGWARERIRAVPEQFFLGTNTPNPFNPETQLDYGLALAAAVELKIYDVLGRPVRTLVGEGTQQPGYYRTAWQGRDDQGRPVASGVYLYRLLALPLDGGPAQIQTRRMLLLR
ncbi:MAG: choice-of-anchor D domain-containing protein [Candidatus Latescibacteria bacterium]|nr:choice-of-anchor D domain-containing protein [Candidatus Latescibacterota bacterium]